MELYVDGYLVAFKAVDVPAREETVVEFQYEFHAAGEHAVEVRIPPDRLTADNQRWLSVPVATDQRAGRQRPRRRPPRGERLVLRRRRSWPPSTSRESWSGADAAESDQRSRSGCRGSLAVRLRLSVQRGPRHADGGGPSAGVRRGGGRLVFTLGDRVKPENYNALLYRDGKGVLPAMLGSPVGTAAIPSRARVYHSMPADSEPSDRRPFRGKPNAGLDRVVTLEYLQAKLAPGSPARVALGSIRAIRRSSRRPVGRGRSVLLTTSADVSWSTWPVHPTFPPMIHEIVRYAAGGRSQERQQLSANRCPCPSSARRPLKSPSKRPTAASRRCDPCR